MFYRLNEILREEYEAVCCLLEKIEDSSTQSTMEGKLYLRCNATGEVVYYIKGTKRGERSSKTLGDETAAEVIALKQAKYNEVMLQKLKRNKVLLEEWMNEYEDYDIEAMDESIPDVYVDKTGLVNKNPVLESAKEWEERSYKKNGVPMPVISNVSSNGTKVRSKSEVIIHDQLNYLGIPFRYDADINLFNEAGERVYKNADFVMRSRNENRLVILEHLGRLDDEKYFENALHKLRLYIRNGYNLNDNLFITADSVDGKINAYATMKLIRHLILPRVK